MTPWWGLVHDTSNATGVNGNQADDSAIGAGALYVFVRSGATWSQEAYLKASNTGERDDFGYSVALSGETIVAGAYGEDGKAGAAYVFVAGTSALPTSLSYRGSTMDADGGPGTVLSATLACPDKPALAAGRTVDFYAFPVLTGPALVAGGSQLVASGVTGANGVVSATWVHDPGLVGDFKVRAVFAGSDDLDPSDAFCTILVVVPGTGFQAGKVSGSGKYDPTGSNVEKLSLSVKCGSTGPASGNLSWGSGNGPHYELSSITITGFCRRRTATTPGPASCAARRG